MRIRTCHTYLFSKFAAEMIEGGEADNVKPSASPKEKSEGKKIEMEHTKDPAVAEEIRDDHHSEDPNYYKKLHLMENPPKLNKEQKLLVGFLRKNPNPVDEGKGGLHEFADKNNINKHKMEEGAYSLLAEYTNSFIDEN